jgi:hypothetical protein
MSKRLTFHAENEKLVIKFDGQPIPAEKLEGLFEILTADVERSAESLQKLYDATQPK